MTARLPVLLPPPLTPDPGQPRPVMGWPCESLGPGAEVLAEEPSGFPLGALVAAGLASVQYQAGHDVLPLWVSVLETHERG